VEVPQDPSISPIRKLLVANRGEVARRVLRTCRELGIRTVAVYSPPDAAAPFALEADEAVALRGARAADSYLDVDQILDAAARTGADAVHPGWGFLAENAGFARRCAAAGRTFIGPDPEAIAAMGSKIGARALMERSGVPVVPGAVVPDADEDTLLAAAARVGYPILVKASAGGGGKGMQLAQHPSELVAAVTAAARQAEASFGDSAVFLERYVSPVRHVEIQVVGDLHGRIVHLGERDCSVQRHHQKLVEEAPSPVVDAGLRGRMGEAAVAAAAAVGYTGVGTVEFLLGPDGDFYFLEMNTRLQVEHPVTEAVTGVDLVRLQVAVAEGRPLPADLGAPAMNGHAVEVRLYAEAPLEGYRPETGTVTAFEFPDLAGLRVDSGVEAGSEIGTEYDSMLAKAIAHGPTRDDALRLLVDALARARLHGVGTNRELLLAILGHDEFIAGEADTGFLDRNPPEKLLAGAADGYVVRVHALAAALAAQAAARAGASRLSTITSGFRNNPRPPAVRRFALGEDELEVGYRLGRDPLFTVNGVEIPVVVSVATPTEVHLVLDGVRRQFSVRHYDGAVHVDGPLGSTALRPLSRFPQLEAERPSGSLVAPMPGRVARVLVAAGDQVSRNDPIVVIEAMKMEHTIASDRDGTVAQVPVSVGDQVDLDQILAVIDDPTSAGGVEPA
jgi:acetyl/propionyl-CoA carboxylase alpha subunit